MELSRATSEHLRNEAYVFLCREVVEEQLDALQRMKADTSGTSPPIEQPAGTAFLEQSTRSTRAAIAAKIGLRTRLSQVQQLEEKLQGILRRELNSYLTTTSAEYAQFAAAPKHLDQWEKLFQPLKEKLIAFADDVRAIVQEAKSGQGRHDPRLFASLRDTAVSLEQHVDQLDQIGRLLASSVAPGSEICVPALSAFRRVNWVSDIFLLSAPQLVAEAARVETEVRQFIAGNYDAILARVRASSATCQSATEAFLENYWAQLRAHAQTNLVEEREIQGVLDELMERYAIPNPARTSPTETIGREQSE